MVRVASSEHYGFVFAVSFILLFSALTITIPENLQGQGGTGDIMAPINPNLISDFSEDENFTKSAFTGILTLYIYYDLGDNTFECDFSTVSKEFFVAKHVLFFSLWLGGLSFYKFVSENGTNRGNTISFTEIETDAIDGAVRYNLLNEDDGTSGGGFVFYWNTTLYADPEDAWDNDVLNLLHGIGMTADTNIASLLVALLFLQLPDVPFLISILIATPLYASIAYILWFIIINMIPFLGGG